MQTACSRSTTMQGAWSYSQGRTYAVEVKTCCIGLQNQACAQRTPVLWQVLRVLAEREGQSPYTQSTCMLTHPVIQAPELVSTPLRGCCRLLHARCCQTLTRPVPFPLLPWQKALLQFWQASQHGPARLRPFPDQLRRSPVQLQRFLYRALSPACWHSLL